MLEAHPRSAGLTLAALLGFAANSVLCRIALSGSSIDPASFTALRLASGALTLALVAWSINPQRTPLPHGASWVSALALFAYASAFSFAYVELQAGTGALLLFGLVQLTMVAWGLLRGEALGARQLTGFLIAILGLLWLTAPGLSAPDPGSALLMALAGFSWGVYSIRGMGSVNPIGTTAGNFTRCLPLAALLWLLIPGAPTIEFEGVCLAIASGALASGLAYSLWYAALRHLRSTQAAALQLSVPVLAAIGGILFLDEAPSRRLLLAGGAILIGIGMAVRRSP